jgi:hypothetical protein
MICVVRLFDNTHNTVCRPSLWRIGLDTVVYDLQWYDVFLHPPAQFLVVLMSSGWSCKYHIRQIILDDFQRYSSRRNNSFRSCLVYHLQSPVTEVCSEKRHTDVVLTSLEVPEDSIYPAHILHGLAESGSQRRHLVVSPTSGIQDLGTPLWYTKTRLFEFRRLWNTTPWK